MRFTSLQGVGMGQFVVVQTIIDRMLELNLQAPIEIITPSVYSPNDVVK